MTEAARQFITFFPKMIWQLFTGVKIPGLNFTPAVFFFGILTFGVVWRLVFSILHVHTFFGRGNNDPVTHTRYFPSSYKDLRD